MPETRSTPHEDDPPDNEPIISTRTHFDGRPDTTAAARDFAADVLTRARATHGLPITARTVEVARLVVSELMTNALKHAPGPCLLDVEITRGELAISVWDTDADLPVPQARDAGRIGQHGLEIVLALCRRVAVEPGAGGKRVRAYLALA